MEDGELLIEREVLAGGKSRAFLGNRPVTLALLRELAPFLGDIHGQHEQQQLFSPESQLELLDEFAGLDDGRERMAGLFRQWHEVQRELAEPGKIRAGETPPRGFVELPEKRDRSCRVEARRRCGAGKRAAGVEKRRALAGERQRALIPLCTIRPRAPPRKFASAMKKLEDLCRIDASLAPVLETLKSAAIGVDEASFAIRDYLDRLEADPDRLEHVESRLALIDKLKRKYGSSLAEVLAFLENVREQIEAVETAGERKAKLEQELARSSEAYREAAASLTKQRKSRRRETTRKVEGELGSLALENAVFRIEIAAGELVRAGRRSRGVSHLGQRWRGAASAGQSSIRRRAVAYRAGSEDIGRP